MEGLIIKNISNDYTVKSNNKNYNCKARGKFKKDKITPQVGDKVTFDEKNNYILKIHKRKNSLIRPSVANIDQALLVTSVKSPDLDTNLLDKLLTIISYNNIEPIRKMSFFLPTIFFIIILNVVFLFINLIIKQCRRELGILKSLGYTTKKIRGLFYTLSSFVYLLAVIIGTIIGYYMTRGVVIYYNKFFYLPLPKYSYNTKMYFIALIALYVVIELATALATLLSKAPGTI